MLEAKKYKSLGIFSRSISPVELLFQAKILVHNIGRSILSVKKCTILASLYFL